MRFESEVSTAKPTSTTAVSSVAPMIHALGHTRSGATSSRNSTLALTRSTRPSGHSVNSSETVSP